MIICAFLGQTSPGREATSSIIPGLNGKKHLPNIRSVRWNTYEAKTNVTGEFCPERRERSTMW
jgi:hypothetical protein